MEHMDLQLFAEEAEAREPYQASEEAEGGGESAAQGKQQRTYTDDDVNRLKLNWQRDLLKSLGAGDDIKTAKDGLTRYRQWLDGQKTDLEKAQGEVATLAGERDELAAQNLLLERKMLTLEQGVPADRAEKYIHLALTYPGAEKDFGKALGAALADFPLATGKKGSAAAAANPGHHNGAWQPAANAGQEAAQRRLERQKRSTDALKQYEGKD